MSDGGGDIHEGSQSDDGQTMGSGLGRRPRKSMAGSLAIHEEEPHEEDNESFKSASSFGSGEEASDARTEQTHTVVAKRPAYGADALVADRAKLSREDPANYLEPARPHGPDSAVWLKLASALRTVVIDEVVQAKMREPF